MTNDTVTTKASIIKIWLPPQEYNKNHTYFYRKEKGNSKSNHERN